MTALQTLARMRIIIQTVLPAAKNVYPFPETNNVLGEIVSISSSFPREQIDLSPKPQCKNIVMQIIGHCK